MDHFEKMSRDDLRKEVIKLLDIMSGGVKSKRILKSQQLRSMSTSELLTFIREHLQINQAEIRDVPLTLKEVFPFEDLIFSDYKETKKGIVRTTVYRNKGKEIYFEKYFDLFEERGIEYYMKIITKIINSFFEKNENFVINDIRSDTSVKIYLKLEFKQKKDSQKSENFAVRSETKELCVGEDREEWYQHACQELMMNMENLQSRGSGWTISGINYLEMNQTMCHSPSGYFYMDLPKCINAKHCVINPKNNDDKCFMWSILAHLHPAKHHVSEIYSYTPYQNELNFGDLTFPMKIKDINKFEKMNDLVVNVVECTEKGQINPLRPSRGITADDSKVINLLYYENKEGNSHYSLIKNLDTLMNKRGEHQKKFCVRCHCSYNVNMNDKIRSNYHRHLEDCGKNKPVSHKLSKKTSVKFKNISNTQKHRYVIYADFESIIEKYQRALDNPNISWTTDVGKHIPAGFCVIVVDSFTKKLYSIKSYIGHNTALEFNKYIIKIFQEIMHLSDVEMRELTEEEWTFHDENKECPNCSIKYDSKEMKTTKVRDHDHLTGEYRGPLCGACNLLKRKNTFIPIFFHNLRGYDSHLIVGCLESTKYLNEHEIDIKNISSNTEKFISFSYKLPSETDNLASKPNFKRTIMYNEELSAVEMEKTNITLDKPIYVGFAILDLSKWLMYDFHYNVMQKKYGYQNVELCYQDTDSLIYDIKTEDFYKDAEEDIDFQKYFDFSDYPKDHVLYSEENKKVVGKFKDELNGKIMTELLALKPKQYGFKTLDGEETKKSKGIKKNIVKNELTLDDYKHSLFNKSIIRKTQYTIRSVKHTIFTQCQNKVALNNSENSTEHKRYIIKDNHSTMAFGNVNIKPEVLGI
ncbi:Protein CBG25359 [Caenorhabditis briggsae]|uniref:Protein CBG25359 n=1 Tax=Caenorhabditis briggsae TaxID=6238 RepID=B6IIM3_CAEBR|nr:Protein CBG25359 [Caenorhabditis briggsae]CAR99753.1 Protein CBG25359 [Caenorhabditis briggsae]